MDSNGSQWCVHDVIVAGCHDCNGSVMVVVMHFKWIQMDSDGLFI